MKNILIPTDFSENSFRAIVYALKMYNLDEVTFTLLHSYKVLDYHLQSRLVAIPGKKRQEDTSKEVNRKLEALVQHLASLAGKNQYFRTKAYNLLLTAAIKKDIEVWPADLIIIGTQGHTEDQKVIFGSNTINILGAIDQCPILAIPAHADFNSIREIVIASSFRFSFTSKNLNFLRGLATEFGADLKILHILKDGVLSEEQKKNYKQLQEELAGVKHSFHFLEHVNVPIGIYTFIESRQSDMITFVNKKHNLLQNFFLQPLSRSLAHYSRVPVLVLHQPKV